jgi:carbon-monoxide dehydrogenase medium subunit
MYIKDSGGLIAGSQYDLSPFALARPRTLREALAVMGDAEAPVPYAGGTDIFASFREGLAPATLVALRDVDELRGIQQVGDCLSLGALLTHADAVRSEELAAVPGLADGWRRIATVRIRHSATLGGNLMARKTRYEMSILLSALGAHVILTSARGESEVATPALWSERGLDRTLLTRVEVPLLPNLAIDYERSMRPTTTQALALWEENGARRGRVVIATEYLVPFAMDLDLSAPGRKAQSIAEDALVGNQWLREAGAVFLKRQLQRLGGYDA